MDSQVSRGYQTGIVDADDISVYSTTVASKKAGKCLATMTIRRQTEARYTIERVFDGMMNFHRSQTKYNKQASTHLGFLQLGRVMILTRWFSDDFVAENC